MRIVKYESKVRIDPSLLVGVDVVPTTILDDIRETMRAREELEFLSVFRYPTLAPYYRSYRPDSRVC